MTFSTDESRLGRAATEFREVSFHPWNVSESKLSTVT